MYHWARIAGFLLFWEVLNWDVIDHYGHLGGCIGGVLMSCMLFKQTSARFMGDDPSVFNQPTKVQQMGSMVALVVMFAVCLTMIALRSVALPPGIKSFEEFCEVEWVMAYEQG